MSISAPHEELEQFAIEFCRRENFDDVHLYRTYHAYKADLECRYSETHPNALRDEHYGSYKRSLVAGSQLDQ